MLQESEFKVEGLSESEVSDLEGKPGFTLTRWEAEVPTGAFGEPVTIAVTVVASAKAVTALSLFLYGLVRSSPSEKIVVTETKPDGTLRTITITKYAEKPWIETTAKIIEDTLKGKS